MGIGWKEFAYDFLSHRYPQAYPPGEVADKGIENGFGNRSKSKDPRQSLDSTLRRWARPGDQQRDLRFGQRYEEGRIVIFAYPPGYSNGDAPETASGATLRDQRMPTEISYSESKDEFNSDCLADLLVEHGEFPHKIDALKAIAELSLTGILLPQRLRKNLESAINQERQAREMIRKLISQLRSLLDTSNP